MRSADQSPGGENLHDRSDNKLPEPDGIAATAARRLYERRRVVKCCSGGDAGGHFEQAIRELTQERETDALIIDFRLNRGNIFLSVRVIGRRRDRR
jgi:hypothetical protein